MSSNSSRTQRIAIVTGASSGIGRYTALGLARTGMGVVMVGRDRDRTEAARRFVTEGSGSDRVAIAIGDFSSLDQVRRLADEILSITDRLDLLVNNAGLMSPKYRFTFEGFELTFAVNHLAPFLLHPFHPGAGGAARWLRSPGNLPAPRRRRYRDRAARRLDRVGLAADEAVFDDPREGC